MAANMESFQALLDKMRAEFLAELSERCDKLDELILALEKSPDDRDVFNELFRGVHSLKGSGGTHGLIIITTICHQLENLLTDTDADPKLGFNTIFTNQALAYLDLLRQVESISQQGKADYSAIDAKLESLRQSGLKSRKSGLIVESSASISAIYKQVLSSLPLQLNVVDSGLTALGRLLHEHFDIIIVGREVKDLNGIALLAALRASHTANEHIPAILVSSKLDSVPEHAYFSVTLARDQKLGENLLAAVQAILAK